MVKKKPKTGAEARAELLAGHLNEEGYVLVPEDRLLELQAGGFSPFPKWSEWDDERNEYGPTNGQPRTLAAAVFDWVRRLPALEKRGLYLYGPPGMGKTTLAKLAAVYAVVAHGYRAPLFLNWTTALAHARGDGGSLDLRPVLRAGLVVLDDLGAERPTHWELEQLQVVVESFSRGKPFLVTSNWNLGHWLGNIRERGSPRRDEDPEAVKLLAARIASRLSTDRLCTAHVHVAWKEK